MRVFLALIACVQLFAVNREVELIEHVKKCIAFSEEHRSHLTGHALKIEGMTGYKVKHFLNNLCMLPNTSYLEIGCWRGSTLVAALYGNQSSIKYAVGIDNWSEFGGPKSAFKKNIKKYLPKGLVHFYERDCFSMDRSLLPVPVNVYFYDGNHSLLSHELAFTYFNDVFEDVFIAVVDDWNWEDVREGTFHAFAKLNYQVLFDQAFDTARDGNGDGAGWWNGIYVAVIKKAQRAL